MKRFAMRALAALGCLAIGGIYGAGVATYVAVGAHEAGHCWVSSHVQADGRICNIRVAGTAEPLRKGDGTRVHAFARMGDGGPQPPLLWWEHPAIIFVEVFVLAGITAPFALLAVPVLIANSKSDRPVIAAETERAGRNTDAIRAHFLLRGNLSVMARPKPPEDPGDQGGRE